MGSNIEVVIPTLNEQLNLPHALRSAIGWADAVHVVDSGSTDQTRHIAEELGAVVTVRSWLGFAAQKNWALDHLPLRADWILFLDADEMITPELRDEMLSIASRPVEQVDQAGFYINRFLIFLGKRIRFCGYSSSWNVRFFKRGRARYEDRQVHEHMIVDGPVGHLTGRMDHDDRRGLEVYMAKHNRYSTLEAQELMRYLEGGQALQGARLLGTWPERRRWIKYHIYLRLPARWLFRFLNMYVVRLGFLDGLTGLHFCLFMSCYELLITLKMAELRRERAAQRQTAAASSAPS